MNNSNLIKLITILLVVTVFTFHVNEAKAWVFVVIWIIRAVTGEVGTGNANFWGILTAILTGGIAPLVGEMMCLSGQDSIWFTDCAENAYVGPTADSSSGQPVLNNQSFTTTCNSASLTYDVSNAYQYGIYRATAGATESTLVNSGSAQGISNITYTDSNLTPQTSYEYILDLTDSAGTEFQYPPQIAYTQCLPECTFSADKSQVVFPETATLSWACSYADSCSISPTVGSVNAQSGTATVSPASITDYILTCQNGDGSISFSSSIDVVNPSIKEVKP
ncbi:MAG: hypothetical protein Q8N22_03295 [bacterium]|nr:hypothetical protein [bacterium]